MTVIGESGDQSPSKEKTHTKSGPDVGYDGEPIIVDWYGADDPENPLNW